MKFRAWLTGSVLTALVAQPALAQQQKPEPAASDSARFYKFDPTEYQGRKRGVGTVVIEARQRVKFEKMLSLKKNFRAKIVDSQTDGALR